MRAMHESGERKIKLSGLPDKVAGVRNDVREMEISIRYVGDNNGQAVVLDNHVIPEIVRAINTVETLDKLWGPRNKDTDDV